MITGTPAALISSMSRYDSPAPSSQIGMSNSLASRSALAMSCGPIGRDHQRQLAFEHLAEGLQPQIARRRVLLLLLFIAGFLGPALLCRDIRGP